MANCKYKHLSTVHTVPEKKLFLLQSKLDWSFVQNYSLPVKTSGPQFFSRVSYVSDDVREKTSACGVPYFFQEPVQKKGIHFAHIRRFSAKKEASIFRMPDNFQHEGERSFALCCNFPGASTTY
jgi:hypothetical protein